MTKFLASLLAGLLLAGAAQANAAIGQPSQEQMQQAMQRQMQMLATLFDYRRSRLGFEETIAAIAAAAERQGWQKGPVHDAQAALKQAGMADGRRMKVILACPAGFNERLAQATQGALPPHPCRFTVFEGRDGKTYIVKMNSTYFARGLQGEAGRLMTAIAADEDAILRGIAE